MATEQTVPQVLGNTPKPPVPDPATTFPPSKGPPAAPLPPVEAE
jgi:hypothetical protein